MCMLTYFPPNTLPDVDALRNGTTFNRDGHGYAIVVYGRKPRLIVRHGLSADDTINQFAKDRAKYPEGPALFHSRFGTSGVVDKYNCHPFFMAGDRRTVVAHNGILPAHMQPHKKDRRCDTRKAADERFTTAYGHLSSESARAKLAKDIGQANKLVILTVDPAYDASAYIVNENCGVWSDGIWYSNYDFESYAPQPGKWDDDDWASVLDDDCPMCLSKSSVDYESQVCTMCRTCLDCEHDVYECECYWPCDLPTSMLREAN